MTDIGKMKWYGMHTANINITYSGLEFDVAKSALQKYVRRGIVDKALLATVEIYRLKEVGGDAAVSNLCNRLAIITVEDIGAANLSLVTDVIRALEDGTRDINKLLAMVQLLCASPKTRMMSHCWHAYATDDGRVKAIAAELIVDNAFSAQDVIYAQQNINHPIFVNDDPESFRWYILIFLRRLEQQDINAFSWAYFYMKASANATVARRRKFINGNLRNVTGKADILLWKALAQVLPAHVHDTFVSAYYNHTENRPFLQCAILAALYRAPYTQTNLSQLCVNWESNPELTKMMTGAYTLVVNDYVIDKHTRLGRLKHKTIKDFVEEGAIVNSQCPIFFNEVLAELYKQR
jgi:hypothetical protein